MSAEPEKKRYFVALCLACEPMLPVPFAVEEERSTWCGKHVEGTGHAVVSVDNVRLDDQVIRDLAAG